MNEQYELAVSGIRGTGLASALSCKAEKIALHLHLDASNTAFSSMLWESKFPLAKAGRGMNGQKRL